MAKTPKRPTVVLLDDNYFKGEYLRRVCQQFHENAVVDSGVLPSETPEGLRVRLSKATFMVVVVDEVRPELLAFALGCATALKIPHLIGYVRYTETSIPLSTPFGVSLIGTVVTKGSDLLWELRKLYRQDLEEGEQGS